MSQAKRRDALILPVVLLVLLLLGLLVAMFAFRVHADVSATQAVDFRLQTRLAAQAGVDRVKLLLRDARYDMNRWYDNIEELHRIIVWAPGYGREVLGSNDEPRDLTMAYRFSIVADDPLDDEEFIRFGITDESSKLNLNVATEKQFLILVRAAVSDWSEEEGEQLDAQSIVNAILDWRDRDSIPRGDPGDTEGAYYRKLPKPYRVKNGPFDTVEELLLVKGVTGRVLYGEDFDRNGLMTPNEDDGDVSFPPDNEDGKLNRGLYPYLTVYSFENNVSNVNRPRVYLLAPAEELHAELTRAFDDAPEIVEYIVAASAAAAKQKQKQSGGGKGGKNPNAATGGGGDASPDKGDINPDNSDGLTDALGLDEQSQGNAEAQTNEQGAQEQETNNEPVDIGPIRTPASLLRETNASGQQIRWNNPLTLEHLPMLMDRTTTVPPEQQKIPGLIDVNTAPRLVLQCIEGLTEEQIDAILQTRAALSAERLSTTAWLMTEGVLELDAFEKVAPQITARGQQFTIESLGYGDHIGMVTRMHVIVDMVGPIAQTVYYRDLTYVGGHYPIRFEDLEKIRGRQK